ncbi:MAG: YraN family protein [Cellvibrionaceae bacterium]
MRIRPLWNPAKRSAKDSKPADRGTTAERNAENYLLGQGLTLERRNFRCKVGEIDLVMRDGPVYVFVEVRYRKHARFGLPAETVDKTKQKKLLRAAQYFLQNKGLFDKVPCRFDVVTIVGEDHRSPPLIDWIENAFSLEY